MPEDWRKANITQNIFKKKKKKSKNDLETYVPVNLTSLHRKVMEHLILGTIS